MATGLSSPMSSVNVSPEVRSRTTTRTLPDRQTNTSSCPRSWKCRPRITPLREYERFACRNGFGSALARARRTSRARPRDGRARCGAAPRSPVDAPAAHEVVHLVVRVDRLACIAPESFHDVGLHQPATDIPVVHVGDLELAATGRLQRRKDLPHLRVVEVRAGDGVATRRRLRLLDDLLDTVAVHACDAEVAQMLVLLDMGEHDARTGRLPREILHHRAKRVLEDVVGEEDADLVACDEALREGECFRDSSSLLLVRVEETIDSVLVAVPEQPKELAGVRPARDEHDLLDAGADQRLDRVRHHRPVVQGEEVLVRDPRERMQARARAPGEDDALHAPAMLVHSPFAAAERYGRKGGPPRRRGANGITGGPEGRGRARSGPPSG